MSFIIYKLNNNFDDTSLYYIKYFFLLIWRSRLVHGFSEDSASCSVKLSALDWIRSLEIKVLYYYNVECRGKVWHIVEWKLQTLNL